MTGVAGTIATQRENLVDTVASAPTYVKAPSLVRGQMLMGIVLIIVGLAVGPGGYSIFK